MVTNKMNSVENCRKDNYLIGILILLAAILLSKLSSSKLLLFFKVEKIKKLVTIKCKIYFMKCNSTGIKEKCQLI